MGSPPRSAPRSRRGLDRGRAARARVGGVVLAVLARRSSPRAPRGSRRRSRTGPRSTRSGTRGSASRWPRAYAGEEVAPGPFPLGGEVHVAASLAELAASTVKEGCVGETVAAVVAAEQLARATDPGGARGPRARSPRTRRVTPSSRGGRWPGRCARAGATCARPWSGRSRRRSAAAWPRRRARLRARRWRRTDGSTPGRSRGSRRALEAEIVGPSAAALLRRGEASPASATCAA